jgi:hypothetical protein
LSTAAGTLAEITGKHGSRTMTKLITDDYPEATNRKAEPSMRFEGFYLPDRLNLSITPESHTREGKQLMRAL